MFVAVSMYFNIIPSTNGCTAFTYYRVTPFSIIFFDPPYRKGLTATMLHEIEKINLLSPDVLVVVEENALSEFEPNVTELMLVDQRSYGETGFWFYRRTRPVNKFIESEEIIFGVVPQANDWVEYSSKLTVKDGGKKPVTLKMKFVPSHPFVFSMPKEHTINTESITDAYVKVVRFFGKFGIQFGGFCSDRVMP